MTNKELFEYSGRNPEPIIDSYYNKGSLVITPTADEKNDLMRGNEELLELITVFNYLTKCGKTQGDAEIQEIITKVIRILDAVAGINFSAFSQFFMVYNSAHSSYTGYSPDEKKEFVYKMLHLYCAERHGMYLSHGYTNSMLQIVADNYSHKRNSKTSIVKVIDALAPYGLSRLQDDDFESQNQFYILPDKGDKELFAAFKSNYAVKMLSAQSGQAGQTARYAFQIQRGILHSRDEEYEK